MTRSSFVVDRRLVLKGTAALAASALIPAAAFAQSTPDAVLFTLADLHAPYARLPALLDEIRAHRARLNVPCAVLLNGDIFERGNVVCRKSAGAADWAFLSALASDMPVIVNLGNHETAILDDMTTFVAGARQHGVQVISNLIDRRTGRFFAPVSAQIGLSGIKISVLGLATTNPFVYREPVRDTLTFLDPAQFVADARADVVGNADLNVIMSHAGVAADKTFIESLPGGTVLHGAHDHLDIAMEHDGIHYFHGGSWANRFGMVALYRGADGIVTTYDEVAVPIAPGDAALADIIATQKSEHLTDADKAVIATIPRDFDLHESILLATEAMRQATDADVAMIGHTTFGQPLTAGPLTKFDFDAYLRFGGGLKLAEVSGETLAGMVSRANQFAAPDLSARTGDYVHVAALDLDPSKTYRLAVNGWTAINQSAYLGTTDLAFDDVDGLELKEVVAAYLSELS